MYLGNVAELRQVTETSSVWRIGAAVSLTEAFAALVRERGIEAPILTETHALLFTGKPPAAALDSLMRRGLRRE